MCNVATFFKWTFVNPSIPDSSGELSCCLAKLPSNSSRQGNQRGHFIKVKGKVIVLEVKGISFCSSDPGGFGKKLN